MHPHLKDLSPEFAQLVETYRQPPPLTNFEVVYFHYDNIELARSERVPAAPILKLFNVAYGISMSESSLNCALSAVRKKRAALDSKPQDPPKPFSKSDADIPF